MLISLTWNFECQTYENQNLGFSQLQWCWALSIIQTSHAQNQSVSENIMPYSVIISIM